MRRNHGPWHRLANHATRHRPPATWPDPAPPLEPETPAQHGLSAEDPPTDWESLWIDLGGEG